MKRKPGRPTTYSPQMAAKVCEMIAKGMSLRKIHKSEKGMPDQKTIFDWLGKHPEFVKQYARARELQMEFYAQQIIEISDDGQNDTYIDEDGKECVNHDVIARSRLRVDTRKWLMSKLAPKKYGDKVEHEYSGEVKLTKIEREVIDVTPSRWDAQITDS